jgi:NAD(P)-dependent dehydrogenase (short-subunit alcohol dehydrogenase family)
LIGTHDRLCPSVEIEETVMDLDGKVAIVTGASAGIGRAYALALAGAGASVVAAARRLGGEGDAANASTLTALLKAGAMLRGCIDPQVCDMEIEADIVRLVDHVAARFGRIDVLVNNAAVLWRLDAFDISGETWDRLMVTNVRGPYIAIREVAPHMKRQQSGSIINITAGAGALTPKSNYPKMLPYAVSKAALNRLSYFMADELKPFGIAVNSLSPGVVASESAFAANPIVDKAGTHKPCTPEVLGPALLYLAQQNAETLTGKILHTDEFRKSWP